MMFKIIQRYNAMDHQQKADIKIISKKSLYDCIFKAYKD